MRKQGKCGDEKGEGAVGDGGAAKMRGAGGSPRDAAPP